MIFYGCANHYDKIFLLSLEEVDKYFGNSGDYLNKKINEKRVTRKLVSQQREWIEVIGYGFSNKNNIKRQAKHDNRFYNWWLRSPGNSYLRASYVDSDGFVCVDGDDVNNKLGIHPTLWLKN